MIIHRITLYLIKAIMKLPRITMKQVLYFAAVLSLALTQSCVISNQTKIETVVQEEDTIWNKTKEVAKQGGLKLTFETVKAIIPIVIQSVIRSFNSQ